MPRGEKSFRIVFAGGGSGGHIYPGIAVADQVRILAQEQNLKLEIHWIGNSKGIDKSIVEKNLTENGGSIDTFHGISSGKLRRYLSFQNIIDIFKIIAGFFQSVALLAKLKPSVLFSKGGFVSVPPCAACRLLKIPYYTHECDFTPGLATRLNSSGAKNIFVSYEETKKYFASSKKEKCILTGNPVRPVFYNDLRKEGLKFLNINPENKKPVLLTAGGSLGARQINSLVLENLEWLKENFIVVWQTGKAFAEEHPQIFTADENYKPFEFIYSEMPSVIQAADVLLSRAGANSLWEAAVCRKPMVLIPLGSRQSRGDQIDNAQFFESKNAAVMLAGEDADSKNLKEALQKMLSEENRKKYSEGCSSILPTERPELKIAQIILEGISK